MKKSIILLVAIGIIGAAEPPCMFPPFLGIQASVVAPHVALVLDYSGSMTWEADSGYTPWGQFDPTYPFYGSFDAGYYYKYDATNGYFYKYTTYNPGDPYFDESNDLFWGHLLNYIQWFARIQVLREALTGKKVVTLIGDTAIADLRKIGTLKSGRSVINVQDGYIYLDSLHTRRLYFYFYSDGDPEGTVGWVGGTFEVEIQTRWWRWWITDRVVISRNPWRLKDHIDNMIGIIEKFSDLNRDGIVDDGKPWWSLIKFNGTSAVILAQKENDINVLENYINTESVGGGTPTVYGAQAAGTVYSLATGDTTTDIFFDSYCGVPETVWCKKAYAIIMSDGYWNNGGEPVPTIHSLHITDLRTGIKDTQSITFFTIFMMNPNDIYGKNAMVWMGLWGGFKDINGDGYPGHFTSYPWDSRYDLFTLPVPYDSLDYQEWDEDTNGIPDNFYEAQTGYQIENAFESIFTKIDKEIASATGAPTFPVSSTGEGFAFQAFFSPSRKNEYNVDIFWLGYLNSLWVDKNGNLREDTDNDGYLNLINDLIVRFRFDASLGQTVVDLYRDANGNAVIDSAESTVVETRTIYDIRAVLKFGDILKNTSPLLRRIKYVDTTATSYILSDFSSSNLPELQRLLKASSSTQADTIIKYIRGIDFFTLRPRYMDGNIWKLGDIVNSTPVYVSSPRERYDLIYGDPTYLNFYNKYKNERGILIAGANDGMLHIFNAGVFTPISTGGTNKGFITNKLTSFSLGEEIIGIIPRALLPHLKYLMDPNYVSCHIYYVDGRPYVTDVKIFRDDPIHPDGWGTILVQGLNFGGVPDTIPSSPPEILSSSYLILDITNPSDINNIKVLTEFSDTLLGYTTSFPAIVKIDTTWYLAMGSGPSILPDAYSDHSAMLYIMDLKQPNNIYPINIGSYFGIDSSFCNDIASTDIALNFNTDRIFLALNQHKPDGTWIGHIIMIKTYYNPDPYTWKMYNIFRVPAPITAEVSPVVDELGNIWVLFGTGRFWTAGDFTLSQPQYLIGFQVDTTRTKTLSDLVDVTDAAVISTSGGDSVITPYGNYSFAGFEKYIQSTGGWYITLNPNERCISRPAVIGGAAIFTTLNPVKSSSTCNPCNSGQAGGTGRIFGLYVKTGTAHFIPILGETVNLGSGRELVKREKEISGLPSEPTLHIGERGGTIYVQTSEGVIEKFDVNIPLAIKKGTIIWKKER